MLGDRVVLWMESKEANRFLFFTRVKRVMTSRIRLAVGVCFVLLVGASAIALVRAML